LTRPGRFDVQVDVDLPNMAGRTDIFKIHTRNKPLAPDVSCELLAQRTAGYSGAEIEGACNRAALMAAERYGTQIPDEADEAVVLSILRKVNSSITLADFDEGVDFVRYGAANESRQKGMTQSDRDNTTVHEAGHAIVCDAMPGTDPIVKLTNLCRSKALGYLQNMPGEDRYGHDFVQLIGRIVTAMGGRAAQEAVLGKMDTGAANDFEQACGIAHNMVTRWGMSRVGIISVGRSSGGAMRGMGGSGPVSNYGAKLADEIDDEWRRIVDECYAMAVRIIEEDRPRLDVLIATLKKKETMLVPDWQEFSAENPSKVDKKTLVLDIAKPAKKGA
jgi:cell division protease FtsH